jgi:Uma2 family endonuclease
VYAAETGFRLSTDPDTVRAPDLAFVSRARVEAVGEVEGFWPGAPDLAIEVVSPGDSYTDVEEKGVIGLDKALDYLRGILEQYASDRPLARLEERPLRRLPRWHRVGTA